MRSRALAARLEAVECPSFGARRDARSTLAEHDMTPIVYARAEGSRVTDVDGHDYIDLVAGFGSTLFGHRNPRLEAVVDASRSELTLALGDVYSSEPKVELCERLAALLPEPGARVLLGSSGADALTAALKTAVLATGKPGLVAFRGSYHGLSHGPLAACGLSDAFRAPFEMQLLKPVYFAQYPRTDAELDASLQVVRDALRGGEVGAVLVEPLLGRGGAVQPPAGFLGALSRLAREHGALLVVDEVWTGLGRTGALLASVAADAGFVPDVLCLGKALGGGYPISACVGRGEVMAGWARHGGSFVHTATHFGAPWATAAALHVLRELCDPGPVDWLARVRELGERARPVHWTGKGLMIGVPMRDAASALRAMRRLLERGVLVLTGGERGNVLTLSPAYSISDHELDYALGLVDEETRAEAS